MIAPTAQALEGGPPCTAKLRSIGPPCLAIELNQRAAIGTRVSTVIVSATTSHGDKAELDPSGHESFTEPLPARRWFTSEAVFRVWPGGASL